MKNLPRHRLDTYPLVKHYIERLSLMDIFSSAMPPVKGEPLLSACLCLLISNIIQGVRPLYQISDWLKDYTDGQGEFGYQAQAYTDDRLADALDALYAADRHSLLTAISSQAIQAYQLQTDTLHNDTTTVSFSGAYQNQTGTGVQLKQGYNKDHQPNAKQVVFGLDVIADGYVPIHYKTYAGNTSDNTTHQANWNELRQFLKTTDFIYIADSKAATTDIMTHLSGHHGQFISLLPATRRETKEFRAALQAQLLPLDWHFVCERENSRQKGQVQRYEVYEGLKTKEGFALLWIRSSAKKAQEEQRREKQRSKIVGQLDQLKLKVNKRRLKTLAQIKAAIDRICASNPTLVDVDIVVHHDFVLKKKGRGPIGKKDELRVELLTTYSIDWHLNQTALNQQAYSDGIFPLVHNTRLSALEVLQKYKNQPYLEKRFTTLKSVLEVAPVFLHKNTRIEALLFLYFIALMIVSLIERQIRRNMETEKIDQLPILPQKMKTKKPTWNNIRYFFRNVYLLVQQKEQQCPTFVVKGMSKLHEKILTLLDIPMSSYQITHLQWWKFQPS